MTQNTRRTDVAFIAAIAVVSICTRGRVWAHFVPIPISVCKFDPITLRVPATGLLGAAQAAVPSDAMRIAFDASSNQIQLCQAATGSPPCGPPVPRPFTLGATTGTLAFPAIFMGGMLSSGDVTIADVPVTVVAGGVTATVPLTLTTSLVAVDGEVAEGVPLQGLGSVTLVGMLAGLPPSFDGQPILVTVSCLPRPVPDKAQFGSPIPAIELVGRITSEEARIRATIDISATRPPDLSVRPVLLAVGVDGATVASAVFSGGLHGDRVLSGQSDDGQSAISVRVVGRRHTSRLVVTARFRDVTLPVRPAGVPVLVSMVLDAGGLIGRGERLFKVTGNGRRLRPG